MSPLRSVLGCVTSLNIRVSSTVSVRDRTVQQSVGDVFVFPRYSSVFPHFGSPTALCSRSSTVPQLYLPTALCSHRPIFPQFYYSPTALCSHSSMFPQLVGLQRCGTEKLWEHRADLHSVYAVGYWPQLQFGFTWRISGNGQLASYLVL